jgi:hypothetical protein
VVPSSFKVKQGNTPGAFEVDPSDRLGHETRQTFVVFLGDKLGLTPIEELAIKNGRGHSGPELLGPGYGPDALGDLGLPLNGPGEHWVPVPGSDMKDTEVPGGIDCLAASGELPSIPGFLKLGKYLFFVIIQQHVVSSEN